MDTNAAEIVTDEVIPADFIEESCAAPEIDNSIYLDQEDLAVRQILNAYYEPETTVDKGEGVRAFIEELKDLSGNRPKFEGLLKLAADSVSARYELEQLTKVAFRLYIDGEEQFLKDVKENPELVNS